MQVLFNINDTAAHYTKHTYGRGEEEEEEVQLTMTEDWMDGSS